MLNKYISIIILFILSLSYSQNDAEYVIFTISDYEDAANLISNLHSSDVDEKYQMITEIFYLDDFEWYNTNDSNLNNYIRQQVLQLSDNTKYLLLLGNEINIPPIYITAADGTLQPSDDFYSSVDEITTFIALENSVPQISTGRISVSNPEEANTVANKLYKYMINPTYGSWRSKIGLIADDENKNGYSRNELNHTINSNNIYNTLSNTLQVSQFYGLNYESVENSTFITKPEMTADVIDYINQGVSLINYIGHGSETTLGGEKIIEMERDLNHICNLGTSCQEPGQEKPAIWVVGTCSFGRYDSPDEIMSEKLLFSDIGAIGLITTSRGIGAYANSIYLTNLFNHINEFVLNNNDYRLGDIVRESKRVGKNTEYLFHLLGDPGLILPFPKVLIEDFMINEEALLANGLEIMKNINSDLHDFGLSYSSHENIYISLMTDDLEFEGVFPDTTINYILEGNQIHAGIISENSCINIPLDIEDCTDCSTIDLALFSDNINNEPIYNGNIQIIKNIPVFLNDNFENDNIGPEISLSQMGTDIVNGSIINKNLDLTITLEDQQGINLMNGVQHNVRYWFNDDSNTYSINSNIFEYEQDVCGKMIAHFSILDIDMINRNNKISIEAWDNGNNRTLLEYNFILEDDEKTYVNNLYNFPNPFKENTFFTFYLSKYPADVEINIYTINGTKIKTLRTSCNEYYNVIKWDGLTDFGEELSNGPYFYSFKSVTENGNKYETINKIAKLK